MKNATYLVKAPPGMLERWHEEAARRGVSLAQLIRFSVNKEIQYSSLEDDDDHFTDALRLHR